MTNDAERVSDIVARLRPSFVTDLPVVQANSKCRDENAAASLSTWLIANNALKTEAADIIEAQSKALAEAREALTEIASLTQTEKLLWWQMRARVALSFLTPTPENANG